MSGIAMYQNKHPNDFGIADVVGTLVNRKTNSNLLIVARSLINEMHKLTEFFVRMEADVFVNDLQTVDFIRRRKIR